MRIRIDGFVGVEVPDDFDREVFVRLVDGAINAGNIHKEGVIKILMLMKDLAASEAAAEVNAQMREALDHLTRAQTQSGLAPELMPCPHGIKHGNYCEECGETVG